MRALGIVGLVSVGLIGFGCGGTTGNGTHGTGSGNGNNGAGGNGSGGSGGSGGGGTGNTGTGSGGDDMGSAPSTDMAGASAGGDMAPSSSGGGGMWWKPAAKSTFYWDLTNAPPDNTKNVGVYDIDGFGNDAAEVSALHAKGIKVVCYMDAGTYEPGRPDSGDFPASLKGNAVQGWPGELWLDVRATGPNLATLKSIMLKRFQVCAQKGFDAVEPDNIDSYQNSPGFTTTAADQLAYNEWIATTVHSLGLAILQKNDLDQIATLQPYFDAILDEECNKFNECDTLKPYVDAGKPAWNAEYSDDGETTAKFCSADVSAGIIGALYSINLDGSLFDACSNDVGVIN